MGVILVGAGFIVEPGDPLLELEPEPIRPYMNGRDLSQTPRGVSVIDLAGLTQDEVLRQYPNCYQRLLDRVKPGRDPIRRHLMSAHRVWLSHQLKLLLRVHIASKCLLHDST